MKHRIAAAALACALLASTTARAEAPAPAGFQLGAVTILVRDEDEAAAWYAANLGLQLAQDLRGPDGERFVALKAPGGAPLIVLHRPGGSAYPPLDRTLPAARIGQETYWVWRTADFDAAYRRLTANHVKFVAAPRVQAYGREAVFEDLYGNLFILQQLSR